MENKTIAPWRYGVVFAGLCLAFILPDLGGFRLILLQSKKDLPLLYEIIFALVRITDAQTIREMAFFFLPPAIWLWLLLALPRRDRKFRFHLPGRSLGDPMLAICVFGLYAWASAVWASDSWETLRKAFLLSVSLGFGYLLIQQGKQLRKSITMSQSDAVAFWLFFFGIGGYFLLLLQSIFSMQVYDFIVSVAGLVMDQVPNDYEWLFEKQYKSPVFNVSFACYAVLFFLLAMLLRSRFVSITLFLGALLTTIIFSANESAKLGLILGVGIVLFLPRLPLWMQRGALWSLLLALTLHPFVIAWVLVDPPQFFYWVEGLMSSSLKIEPRFDVYAAFLVDIANHPWLGHGLHASRIDFPDLHGHGTQSYPHNYTLQLLVELGIIGLLLFVWVLGSLLHAIETLDERCRPYLQGAFFCALSPAAFNFDIWDAWWTPYLYIMMFLFVLFAPPARAPKPSVA